MNMPGSNRERLHRQLQAAHRDRANALIERRITITQLEALQRRIEDLDEYVQSLARALEGPAYSASPVAAANRR